eukprot:10063437-Heterocapsa_arctica.AAC.1
MAGGLPGGLPVRSTGSLWRPRGEGGREWLAPGVAGPRGSGERRGEEAGSRGERWVRAATNW